MQTSMEDDMSPSFFAFAALAVGVVLAGCATPAKYEAKLNAWIGASENSLIAAWGVPEKEYSMADGRKAIAYIHKDAIQTGGVVRTEPQVTYQTGTIGGTPYSGTSTTYTTEIEPPTVKKLYCKTSFVINAQGIIESWHHEGNNCVSH